MLVFPSFLFRVQNLKQNLLCFLAPDNFLKYLLHVPTPQGTNKPSKKQTFWRPFATKDPDSGIPETRRGWVFSVRASRAEKKATSEQ